jgi:Leucine-rich repeat (LRR) protein
VVVVCDLSQDNALTALPSELGRLTALQALFLTGNQLATFPSELGGLASLRKLQAGANRLTALPSELGLLSALELFRAPMNNLKSLPRELATCPKLAWLALGGNPISDAAPPATTQSPNHGWSRPTPELLSPAAVSIALGSNLADAEFGGAANDGVHPGTYTDPASGVAEQVAVKFFKPGVGPDGDPKDEMLVGAAVHALLLNLRPKGDRFSVGPLSDQLGVLAHPRPAAVFRLIEDARPLAKKPLDTARMLR